MSVLLTIEDFRQAVYRRAEEFQALALKGYGMMGRGVIWIQLGTRDLGASRTRRIPWTYVPRSILATTGNNDLSYFASTYNIREAFVFFIALRVCSVSASLQQYDAITTADMICKNFVAPIETDTFRGLWHVTSAEGLHDRPCASCEEVSHQNLCSKCKAVVYCGKDCQREDWKKHKVVCQGFRNEVIQTKMSLISQ
jgi:hypothetical protein